MLKQNFLKKNLAPTSLKSEVTEHAQTAISWCRLWFTDESFSWKKSGVFIFSISWNGKKFKLTLGISLDKWSWLFKSSIWSHYFVWKWFLVSKLHISHVKKKMTVYHLGITGITWSTFNFVPYIEAQEGLYTLLCIPLCGNVLLCGKFGLHFVYTCIKIAIF